MHVSYIIYQKKKFYDFLCKWPFYNTMSKAHKLLRTGINVLYPKFQIFHISTYLYDISLNLECFYHLNSIILVQLWSCFRTILLQNISFYFHDKIMKKRKTNFNEEKELWSILKEGPKGEVKY